MNIFKVVTGNIVKWWQLVVMPILRIDNNSKNAMQGQNPNMQQDLAQAQQGMQQGMQQAQNQPVQAQTANQIPSQASQEAQKTEAQPSSEQTPRKVGGDDAQAVMDRINREREEKRKRDLEKAQEEARLASIMNANKVDVNAFIQAGKEAIEEKKAEQVEVSATQPAEQATEQTADSASDSAAMDDAAARAQEIIDRLNREAMEDEMKKQAEIESARQQAKDTFGV